jgi:transcriptional regulator with XRE-family HTH domain
MNITAKIHQLRKEKKWSVARLAREAGIPTVSLRAMLARSDPNAYNVKNLIKIAKALGVTVSYLTEDDENEPLKPKLTIEQKKQLVTLFSQLLDQFFKIEGNEDEQQQN